MLKFSLDINYRAAIYLRLSMEDGDFSFSVEKLESDSLSNQRMLILDYLKKHQEITVVDEYIDDGFTGANFERPDFNRMMDDVKAGKIDANIERIRGAIFSKLEDYAGYEGYLYGKISESPSLGLLNFEEQVLDVTDTLREYLSALEDIQGLPYETYGQKVAGEWLNKEKESLLLP